LLLREPIPGFEGPYKAHEALVHGDPDTSDYEYRQLIEAIWTLDDARWREVERGLWEHRLREQSLRRAKPFMVLHEFMTKGRRWPCPCAWSRDRCGVFGCAGTAGTAGGKGRPM
jgi:hypothetical protein